MTRVGFIIKIVNHVNRTCPKYVLVVASLRRELQPIQICITQQTRLDTTKYHNATISRSWLIIPHTQQACINWQSY